MIILAQLGPEHRGCDWEEGQEWLIIKLRGAADPPSFIIGRLMGVVNWGMVGIG